MRKKKEMRSIMIMAFKIKDRNFSFDFDGGDVEPPVGEDCGGSSGGGGGMVGFFFFFGDFEIERVNVKTEKLLEIKETNFKYKFIKGLKIWSSVIF